MSSHKIIHFIFLKFWLITNQWSGTNPMLPFPSPALPGSGSVGIISALILRHLHCINRYKVINVMRNRKTMESINGDFDGILIRSKYFNAILFMVLVEF